MPLQQPRSASAPKFRIAICGGGVGGLVFAITIGKYDPYIPIDIYEAHSSIESAGVGITVWKKTHEVMTELGLFDDFKQIFTPNPQNLKVRRSDIPEGGYPWFEVAHRHGRSAMHRKHMIAVLEKHLPASCTVHSKKRLVNFVEQNDAKLTSPVILEWTTDILIGADGVRSAVRRTMFEAASSDDDNDETGHKQYMDATFCGIHVYRALVSVETLKQESPENIALTQMTGYSGKGRFFGTFPIAKSNMVNVVAYTFNQSLTGTVYDEHWMSDATTDELLKCFDDFEPDVRTVTKLCEKLSKWALHVVQPLPFCARNRVAHIGDACHAMTPYFGAGGVEAIEDAFILGRLIAHPLTRIQGALRIYEEVRLPIARSVASVSLSTGWMYTFTAPGYYDGARKQVDLDDCGIDSHEKDGMETIEQEILRRWDLLDGLSSALEVWKEAERKLQALAGETTD